MTEQKQIYQDEIRKVWESQYKALSSTLEPTVSDDEDGEDFDNLFAKKTKMEFDEENERRRAFGYSQTNSPAPLSPPFVSIDQGEYSDLEDEVVSLEGSIASRIQPYKKSIVVKRLVKNDDGVTEWKSETITDARVIMAYTRQRQMIENTDRLEPLTDPNDERKRKRQRTKDRLDRLTQQSRRGKKRPEKKGMHSKVEISGKLTLKMSVPV
ncbi:hypothetical protein HK096_010502 [Nowakowskiella sp. JEL0078]|nr:hypothetical protein HK096_010502 [Nowakowskiella sp. JEL0078]